MINEWVIKLKNKKYSLLYMNRLLLNRRRSRSVKESVKKESSETNQNSLSEEGYIKGMYVKDSSTGKKVAVKATPELCGALGCSCQLEKEINNLNNSNVPDNVINIALKQLKE